MPIPKLIHHHALFHFKHFKMILARRVIKVVQLPFCCSWCWSYSLERLWQLIQKSGVTTNNIEPSFNEGTKASIQPMHFYMTF